MMRHCCCCCCCCCCCRVAVVVVVVVDVLFPPPSPFVTFPRWSTHAHRYSESGNPKQHRVMLFTPPSPFAPFRRWSTCAHRNSEPGRPKQNRVMFLSNVTSGKRADDTASPRQPAHLGAHACGSSITTSTAQ